MRLTVQERMQFPAILPAYGDIATLTVVEQILNKLRIESGNEDERDYSFSAEEMMLLKQSVHDLDQQQQAPFSALSIIKKIIMEEE